jgi:D-glycero-alpha-D-manno-heptose-7-phosphate kinase
MKRIVKEGSVRVDLLGGTIDLPPINLIIPDVVTLNLATSLKAKVTVSEIEFDGVEIISKDYKIKQKYSSADFTLKKIDSDYFNELKFISLIIKESGVVSNVLIELESGSPPGAGLGGSSAMGVTLMSALNEWGNLELTRKEIIKVVNGLESKMLNSGRAGYQDYYPALYGGILALTPTAKEIRVDQLYSKELKGSLENGMTLVFSGENRHSGINNWEVYKRFFDKDESVIRGLTKIANLSSDAYRAIKENNFQLLISLIAKEGEEREKLFPGITTPKMKQLLKNICKESIEISMKPCGAGGGGCFHLIKKTNDKKIVLKCIKDIGTVK